MGDDMATNLSRIDSTLCMVMTSINNLNVRSIAAEAVNSQRLNEISTATNLISSTTLDTNARVSDLKFGQFMQSIKDPKLWKPRKTFDYLAVHQKRSPQNEARKLSEGCWEFARMGKWARSRDSNISIVKADFRSRHALRCFSVSVIEQLRLKQVPVLFALKTSQEGAAAKSMSNDDFLKYLILQAIGLRRSGQTEKSMSLNAAAFLGDVSAHEWFSLLQHLLCGLCGSVYFVVDLDFLNRDLATPSGFHWLSAFLGLFKSVAERGSNLTMKVLLVTYSSVLPLDTNMDEFSGFVVPAKNKKLVKQRRRARAVGARGRGRQSRLSV